MPNLPISVQLFTLRDETDKDFAGTIQKVAAIGYVGVEFAGYGTLNATEIRTLLEDNNLRASGSHVGIWEFENKIDDVISDNLTIGNNSVIVPWIGEEYRTPDGYRKLADLLNKFGEKVSAAGLTVGYHNHDFEFKPMADGSKGYEILIQNTDPGLVSFELDTYWALVAGEPPAPFITANASRINLLHIKDRDLGDGSFAEIGTGDLPLSDIAAAAKAGGKVKWLVVEQDVCKNPPIESVTTSFNNLKALGYV